MTTKMQNYLAVQKKKSEITSRPLEIRLTPEPQLTAELRQEVTTLTEKQAEVEKEFKAALAGVRAEEEQTVTVVDAEARALQVLAKTASVGEAITAVSEHRRTEGATAEIQAHFKLPSNQIPIEMLRIDRAVEERAAATVPANIGDASQAEVVTPVFASGDGAFLGIERPIVDVGDATFPILKTAPSVKGPFSDSSDAAQTDASFEANNLSPQRLQASYAYRRSDAARFLSLDSSLRMALNGGLSEALDKQAISGSKGLLSSTNLDNHNVSSATTFALFLSQLLYSRVDGRYARTPADVRVLVGQGTFAAMSGVYKAAESDETASERLTERSGGLVVSPHVPAIASSKQNNLVRLGMDRGGASQPVWRNVSIVVDEVTRATQGEVIVSAFLMSNFAIVGANRFFKQQVQV